MGTFDDVILTLQCQALFILTGFFVAWYWAAWRRGLGIAQLERRGTTRTAYCKLEKARSRRADGGGDDGRDGDEDGDWDFVDDGRDGVGVGSGDASSSSRLPTAPMVSVVMPVKGVKAESLNNWRTQLQSGYRGQLEYVFVAGIHSSTFLNSPVFFVFFVFHSSIPPL